MDIENQAKQDNKDTEMVDENQQGKTMEVEQPQDQQHAVEEQQKQQQQPVKEESAERQKQILKETFEKLVQRLKKGCGREKCRYDTCIANPRNKHLINDANKASQKAIEILRTKLAKVELCNVVEKPIKSLQRAELEHLLSPQSLEHNLKEVLARIEEVFSDFEALNNSFFTDQNPYQFIEEHNGMLDFESIQLLYNTLFKINDPEQKKAIEDTFSKSFIHLLGEIQSYQDYKKRFLTFDDFRVFGPIVVYPTIFEDHTLFIKIMHSFFYLTQKEYEMLGYWFKNIDAQTFERINTDIKTKVMICLFEGDTEVEAAMNALKIIYTSNVILKRMERDHFIIDIFLQDSEEGISPKSEYIYWLKSRENTDPNKRIFSFCNYPFSMDIKFKYLLLEINSKSDQKMEHDKKIRSLIDQGQIYVTQAELFLIFEVSRDNILEDTLICISKQNLNFKLPFKVKFRGEQGIDEGGVRKEYYQIMIKQLFNPDFGLFVEKQNRQFNWFNGNSISMPMYYELIGSLMGMAIYNQIQMDVRFPNVVYKKIIGDPVSLEDIKQFDLSTYNGFKHILNYEGDLENDLQLTFSIEYDNFGEQIIYELIPGGDKIHVNQENKKEFIELYVDWYLNKSIEKQFNNFKKGFFKVLNMETIKIFTFDELVLILTGKEELDFSELRKYTVYDAGYSDQSDQIVWLWEALEEFSIEQRKKFLFFCTGSDRAPVTGLASLRFVISKHGEETEQLPSAHTCFNHLLIPAYKSKEILKQKLLLSLDNAEGFGLY